MIDTTRLAPNTTIQCSIDDLPQDMQEEIRVHMYEDEKVNLCLFEKEDNKYYYVKLVTSERVIRTSFDFKNGGFELHGSDSSTSVLIDRFGGFSIESRSVSMILDSGASFTIYFRDKKWPRLFARTILNSFREGQKNKP